MDIPYKKLSSGVKMPVLGLGTWKLKQDACTKVIQDAWHAGYRHIDTADVYQNHLDNAKGLKGASREELFLVSKLWHEEHHPDQVEPALDRALKELQVDYLDAYLVHWPKKKGHLPDVIYKMDQMMEKGKIRTYGMCNGTIHHMQDVLNQGLKLYIHQFELHPLFVDENIIQFCQMQEIAITAYSPLGKGEILQHPTLVDLAKKKDRSPAQIVLAWCLHKDFIAIPKASSPLHLEQNIASCLIRLSVKEVSLIDAINENKRLIHPDFAEFDY